VDKWSGSRGEGEELKANLHEQMQLQRLLMPKGPIKRA